MNAIDRLNKEMKTAIEELDHAVELPLREEEEVK